MDGKAVVLGVGVVKKAVVAPHDTDLDGKALTAGGKAVVVAPHDANLDGKASVVDIGGAEKAVVVAPCDADSDWMLEL